jgi:transposase InsO family protein
MNHRKEFSIKAMCRVLGISRAGYYEWANRKESPRAIANCKLTTEIRAVFEKSDSTYGSPRIADRLRKQGLPCSKSRAARLMRKAGLRSVHRHKLRVITTDSRHAEPVAENLVAQDFSASAVGEKVGCDITYVPTDEGWLYLAVVLDFFSRKVLGFAFSDSLESGLVCEALIKAVGNHRLPSKLIHHSDRGVQYAGSRYRALIKSLGMTQSMSRRGNCYDNAITESFFHSLKVERIHRRRYRTRKIAAVDIASYIDNWYNTERLHSSLGMTSPVEFIAQQSAEFKQLAA